MLAAVWAGWTVTEAAPDGAPGGLHWWLLVGGGVGTVIAFVLSSALYRAYCRRGSRGHDTSSFFIGLTGFVGLLAAFMGATKIIAGPPSGPPADTRAFLFLLAATVGTGAILVGAFILSRNSVPPPQDRGPAQEPESVATDGILLAIAVDLVAAVLAVLGAAGVLHLSVVETVAWAYVGVGLGGVAVLVLIGIVWNLVAI